MRKFSTSSVSAALVGALLIPILSASDARAIRFWGEDEAERAAEAAPDAATDAPAGERNVTHNLPDFTWIVDKIGPSIANISTTAQVQPQPQMRGPDQFGGQQDFWTPFERFFGPMPRRQFRERSLGSGFIISKDGVILTNNHVIDGADEIIVKLADNSEHKATVIGRDPKTDIAVIKIEAPDLKPVPLGNSESLRVGEWVVAIGNPFGLESTVTAGIVSAKGRFIGQGSYDQFIQTDVAINPGNSGGPLINLKGEVVGINTAIFSRSGGNIGIGFAIPINLAKELLPQLEEKGKVTRGWLGVLIQKVTRDIAESLDLPEARGALVADVLADGPAKAAGIQVGDVIVQFDGHAVGDSNELPFLVARTPVGKAVEVVVLRNGKPTTVSVTIAELEDEGAEPTSTDSESFGLTVQPLTPEIAESLGLDTSVEGVVVSGVEEGSSAEDAGLRRGDVIIEVNRTAVKDLKSYRKALEGITKGKTVLLLVRRGDNTIFVPLKP